VRTTGGATSRKASNVTVTEEAERCFELRAKGRINPANCWRGEPDKTTAQRRIEEICARRISPKVEKLRAVRDGTLDAVQAEMQQIIDTAIGPELRLKAIDRPDQLMKRRAVQFSHCESYDPAESVWSLLKRSPSAQGSTSE
jgi:hypothetical protein